MLSVVVSTMRTVGLVSSSGITPAKAGPEIRLKAPPIAKFFISVSKSF